VTQDASSPRQTSWIGLMSGTSLDGVDGVLVTFDGALEVQAHAYRAFEGSLHAELLALNSATTHELDRYALAGQHVADLYAEVVAELHAACPGALVSAVGAHGVTLRHQPQRGYTVQALAPARLAELTQLDVVADFRSRDVAAGGQGAPLVPAFHAHQWHQPDADQLVLNLGGFSNLTHLPRSGPVTGFDCGPGNVLMDLWIQACRQHPFDADGRWAASGQVDKTLLARLSADPYFARPAPKSTGRDDFHEAWLRGHLAALDRQGHQISDVDVQSTLCELTAWCVAVSARLVAPDASRLIVCGGGAANGELLARLQTRLHGMAVVTSDALGLPAQQVEATAFAWLARQALMRQPGNLPSVTGARGPRILGALYAA